MAPDASAERAAALGLPRGTREFDLEGVAFHRRALYVGGKASLGAQGSARIWRVVFDAGGGAPSFQELPWGR